MGNSANSLKQSNYSPAQASPKLGLPIGWQNIFLPGSLHLI